MIERKRRLRRSWQRTRCPTMKSSLNALAAKISSAVANHAGESWQRAIERATDDWSGIHRLCRSLAGKPAPIRPLLAGDGTPRYRAEDRAELFADSLEATFQPNPARNVQHTAAIEEQVERKSRHDHLRALAPYHRRPPDGYVGDVETAPVVYQLLHAARVRRGLTTADLNLHGQPKRVYVNEHLTRSNARLFHLAREAGQRSRYKYVWTREGRIYARKEDGVSAVRIRSDADINKIFGDAYRPPWLDVDTFLDSLTVSINSLPFCDYTVLLGDFNINYASASPRDCNLNKLHTFLNHFNFNQLVTSPTHFSTNNSSLIDLVCTDAKVTDVKVYPIEALGAHAFITSTFRIKREKIQPRVITYRGLKSINFENFKDALEAIDWRGVVSSDDVDYMVYCLTNELLCLFDTFAPRKTVRIKDRSYPWITDNIKFMMKLRDKAHKEFRNKSTLVHKKQYYVDLKNLVNKSIYFEKVAYFKSNINNNISHPKLLWKNLKSTLLPQKCCAELPTHLKDPDRINSHFLNVPGDTITSLSTCTYYEFHRFSDCVFTLKTMDETKVLKVITSLKSNAEGSDQIALNMFILTIPQTLTVLTRIINTSIVTANFPDAWKLAKDLRPISILPLMSKVLERVVGEQMSKYIEDSGILPDVQSGFSAERAIFSLALTATALLDVTDNILGAQDEGMCTILVLLDFSRAFDSINLSLLISKMAYYGFDIPTIKWPEEYASAVNLINEDLDRIVDWSSSNCLILNPSKTKFLLFGTKTQLNKIPSSSADVLLRGQIIERVSEARNLGLLMDEGLRFESHISNCVRNCFYRLKVLYRMRPYLSEELRVQLVESLVLSRLNYADVVIGPRLLSRTERLIQRVQNACARSFRYAASKCWNNIPPPIRNLQTTFSFKRKLKEFIINSQIESETINIDISFI
ncbi:hypothetical protein SFRURICE_007101 [Spodoptera frugiperda]|nr:hypothetical protein SFRURICE_007101 [Spodoptera frugiperda]